MNTVRRPDRQTGDVIVAAPKKEDNTGWVKTTYHIKASIYQVCSLVGLPSAVTEAVDKQFIAGYDCTSISLFHLIRAQLLLDW